MLCTAMAEIFPVVVSREIRKSKEPGLLPAKSSLIFIVPEH